MVLPSGRLCCTAAFIASALATATVPRALAETPPTPWKMPPGWTETRGGDGGKVIRVTTIEPRGKGSLAEALAASGPRVIEFAVAGTIDLGGRSLTIAKPEVTVAGESAPEPGITLTNGGLNITTNDVIVRHLRIRPGSGGKAKKSGWEVDGLTTVGARDVIIDHCSIAWATDENLSASGPRFEGATPDDWRRHTSRRITFSHNLVAEALHDSTHSKGPHSKGSLIHDNTSDIAIVGNLYLSNHDRNPLFKGGARGAVVNNLIVNPGVRFLHYALVPSEWKGHAWQRGAIVAVGNVARRGPSTNSQVPFLEVTGPCDVHLKDNQLFDADGKPLAIEPVRKPSGEKSGAEPDDLQLVAEPMLWPPRLEARPAVETAAWVLANAGARPWDRDATDRRLIGEAKAGGGRIINFESEAGAAAPVKP